MAANISINGQIRRFDGDETMPLLWYLREELGLKGTKYGCGIGQCGACVVDVNGEVQRSCLLPVSGLDGALITTIEGLSPSGDHPVQTAWIEEDVAQCGYCQAGQIMAAAALLKQNPHPDDAAIDSAMNNICRCGTYYRIRIAIKRAAQLAKGRG